MFYTEVSNDKFNEMKFDQNEINMKFGQILMYLIANISSMFLAQCCRLETSSGLFYDFNEMAI